MINKNMCVSMLRLPQQSHFKTCKKSKSIKQWGKVFDWAFSVIYLKLTFCLSSIALLMYQDDVHIKIKYLLSTLKTFNILFVDTQMTCQKTNMPLNQQHSQLQQVTSINT